MAPVRLTKRSEYLEVARGARTPRRGFLLQSIARRLRPGDEAAGAVAKAATLPVEVKLPNVELENPALDRAALESLASATSGAVFDVTQGSSVVAALKLDRVQRVLEDRQEVWDAPLFYGAVFLLLVVEWVLRKRCRLI